MTHCAGYRAAKSLRVPRLPSLAEPLERRQLLAATVSSLTLINADTDQPVPGIVFENGAIIDLAQTGRRLNIRADVSEPAGSVRFNYDANPNYKIEASAAYAIGGNTGSDYWAWTPTLGTHTLVATAYAGAGGTGERGGSRAVTFTVVDSSPLPPPVRVNAGGSSFTTGDGRVFVADTNFSGGTKYAGTFAVAGTTDDALYRTRREGSSFTFSRPVTNGTYVLTLHFAEPTKTARGQRKFDVRAENKLVLNDFDVFAAAGARQKAVTRTITVPVSDGQLNLSFKGVVSSAIVSAVELVAAAPAPLKVPAPAWVNAGGGRFVDGIGRVFEAETGFTGGTAGQADYDVMMPPDPAFAFPTFYADDALLLDYRSGASFSFSRPLANGNYAVWLEFAEPMAGAAAGQRVFDVSAEGALTLDDYDVVADAGAAQWATARTFNVTVRDGRLDLAFAGVVGEALVGALAIVPIDIPAAALPYAGVSRSSDPLRQQAIEDAWLVRSASNLRQIGQTIFVYGNERKGRLPADLATLMLTQDTSHTTFSSPQAATSLALPRGELSLLEQVAWVDATRDYVYLGAGKRFIDFGRSDWFAYENPDRAPGARLAVLFGDGRVEYVPRADVIARHGGTGTVPAFSRPLEAARDPKVIASQSNLRQISQAARLYANEHRAVFPPDFGTLYGYDVAPATFVNPRGTTPPPPSDATDEQKIAWINASTDYVFRGAGGRVSRYYPDEVVAYENPADMATGINLLFGDGRVEFREMRYALEALARPRP